MLPRNSVSSKCTRFALDLILLLLQQKQTNKDSKLYYSFHLKHCKRSWITNAIPCARRSILACVLIRFVLVHTDPQGSRFRRKLHLNDFSQNSSPLPRNNYNYQESFGLVGSFQLYSGQKNPLLEWRGISRITVSLLLSALTVDHTPFP